MISFHAGFPDSLVRNNLEQDMYPYHSKKQGSAMERLSNLFKKLQALFSGHKSNRKDEIKRVNPCEESGATPNAERPSAPEPALIDKEGRSDDDILSWVTGEDVSAVACSLRGRSHIHMGTSLQDRHILRTLSGGCVFAAVADGVGSEPRSDEGAQIACESVATFFAERYAGQTDKDTLCMMMAQAFQYAYDSVRAFAKKEQIVVNQLSTTLHAALLTKAGLLWGHAGDGGILCLNRKGILCTVTSPMTAEDGESVIPLTAGPKWWQFGFLEEECQSVLLCTDGVFNRMSSKILRNLHLDMDRSISIAFLSPYAFDWNGDLNAIATAYKTFFRDGQPDIYYPHVVSALAQGTDDRDAEKLVLERIFDNNRPLSSLQQVYDDITVAVVQRTDCLPEAQNMEYYLPPDYRMINRRVAEILYSSEDSAESSKEDADCFTKD